MSELVALAEQRRHEDATMRAALRAAGRLVEDWAAQQDPVTQTHAVTLAEIVDPALAIIGKVPS